MNVTGVDTKYFLIHTSGLVIDKTATSLHKVEEGVVTDLDIKRTFMLVNS